MAALCKLEEGCYENFIGVLNLTRRSASAQRAYGGSMRRIRVCFLLFISHSPLLHVEFYDCLILYSSTIRIPNFRGGGGGLVVANFRVIMNGFV